MALFLRCTLHRPLTAVLARSFCSLSPPSSMSTPKPEISEQAQEQQQKDGVPPAKPTGTLQDRDPNELIEKRNQILWEQAQRGEQPGLTLMQDALSGENKAQTWGNEPTIMEPDKQN